MSLIKKWIGLSEPPVRRANGRGLDSDQDFIVLGRWLFNVPHLNALRGPYLVYTAAFISEGLSRPLQHVCAYWLSAGFSAGFFGAAAALTLGFQKSGSALIHSGPT